MKKHFREQRSAKVVIVVCLVLVLLTALGWIFYQNFVYKESVKQDSELIVTSKEDEVADADMEQLLSADWLEYSSPKQEYRVRLPDGWKVYDADGLLHVWSDMRSGRLDYVEGTEAVAEDIEGGRDGIPSFWLQSNSGSSYSNPLQDGKVLSGFKTYQGLSVNKYYKLWTDQDTDVFMPSPKGTKDYVYEIEKSDKKVFVRYAFFPGEFDEEQLEIVEELVKTVEL
jgi:hypothetical protein